MCMGHLQLGGVDDHVINSDDVNVHEAVDVASVGISVSSATQAALDVVDAVQHLHRGKVTGKFHAQVKETVLALKSPRLTLHNAGHGGTVGACRKKGNGAIEIIAPITYV